ncbi:MAG: rhodanese-like domain-containing protein [bacterium]
MLFRMLYDHKLAQASYLIGCQRRAEAIVIDPQRDVDRYIELAKHENMNITAITETHIHADFLSGARELAERTGARLYLSDEGDADWKYQWLDKKKSGGCYTHQLLKDGATFQVGYIQFQAMHTPGHTPLNSSFPTVAGSYVEPNTSIYLIVENERVKEAVTDLIRIGLDEVMGYASPAVLRSYFNSGGALVKTKSVEINELKNLPTDAQAVILDVRQADEFEASHLPGAMNIPHTRLLAHLGEVPKDKAIWVHCRTSERSAYATAMLERHGCQVTHLAGGFLAWQAKGDNLKKLNSC